MHVVIEETEIITGPGVVIEDAALAQLRHVAGLPGCVRAVGLPDLHPGMHGPVGATFAFDGVVRPALVGSDAGCGVRLTPVLRSRFAGDALERRIRQEMDGPPFAKDLARAAFEALLASGLRGLANLDALPPTLQALAANEPEEGALARPAWLEGDLIHALGTIGGGNHFAEISEVQGVVDADAGFARRGIVILVHSGSRGLGKALGDRWRGEVLEARDPRVALYLSELHVACRFARANRFVLAWRLASALGAAREGSLGASVDVHHNTVSVETLDGRPVFLHRKGAAPAHAGALTVVLGSRGAPSWVLRGLGQEETLRSVAHGAGRRIVRSEAVARLRPKYTRRSLERTALGGRVLCEDTGLLYEEHPDAYKPIDPVVDALVARGTATRVASLVPLFTVKL